MQPLRGRTSIHVSNVPVAVIDKSKSSGVRVVMQSKRPTSTMGGNTTRMSPDTWARIPLVEESLGPGSYGLASPEGTFDSTTKYSPLNGMTTDYVALQSLQRRIKKIKHLQEKKRIQGSLSTTEELLLKSEAKLQNLNRLTQQESQLEDSVHDSRRSLLQCRKRSPTKHSLSSAFRSSSKRFPELEEQHRQSNAWKTKPSTRAIRPSSAQSNDNDELGEKAICQVRAIISAQQRPIPAPTFWPSFFDASNSDDESDAGSSQAETRPKTTHPSARFYTDDDVFFPKIRKVRAPCMVDVESEQRSRILKQEVEHLQQWEEVHLKKLKQRARKESKK